jgi:uncharacterized protein YneF (UPF0154 family)
VFVAVALIVSYFQQYFVFKKAGIELEKQIPDWFYFGFAIFFLILGFFIKQKTKDND